MRKPGTTRQPRRRVLIFQPSDDSYGLDRVLIRIVDVLIAGGYDVTCVVESRNPGSGWVGDELARRRVAVSKRPLANVSRSALRNPLGILRWLVSVVAGVPAMIQLSRSADLIYVNGFTLVAAALAGRLGRRPVLWHLHEIPPGGRLSGTVVRALSSRQVCVSRAVADAMRLSGRTTCDVIHNAVDVPTHVVEQPEVSHKRPLEIGIVARISRNKGHLVLAEAFEQLVAEGVPARLHIVGGAHQSDTSVEDQLRHRLRTMPAEKVVWAGEVPSGAEYMQQLHVLAAPSTVAEALGMSVLEAMAAGVAVVATRVGGHRETVDDRRTGILVNSTSTKELASAIGQLARDSRLRGSLAVKARERVNDNFGPLAFNSRVMQAVETTMLAYG